MDSSDKRLFPVHEQQLSLVDHAIVDSARQTASRRLDTHTAAEQQRIQNQMACVDPHWAQAHHLNNFAFSSSFDLYQGSPAHLTHGEYGVAGPGTFEYPTQAGPLNANLASSLGTIEHGEGFRDLKNGGRHHHHRDGQTGGSVSVSPKSVPNVMTINHAPRGSPGQASPWNRGQVAPLDGDGTPIHDHSAPPPAADEEQKPPAWSLLKTKAGKQRRRLPLACFACRQKKVRCSGEQPTCKHCHRWRITCVYKTRTRKATATRKGSKELQDLKHGELSNVDENPSELLSSAKSTVAPNSRRTSSSTKWTGHGKRSIEEAFGGDQEQQAEGSPIYEIQRERPPITPQHQRFNLKDTMPSEESDRTLSTSIQGHLSGVPFDFVNSPYPVLHQQDIGRRSSANGPSVLVLAVCTLPGPSQGQAGPQARRPSETLEGSRSTSFQGEHFDATDSGQMLNHYYHPPMVLPQHANLSSGLPTTLQGQEEQPPVLYPEEDTHATAVGSALIQSYHPPMILPQQMYHSDLYPHDAQGTAESGLASYHPEPVDTDGTHVPFGTDIHPPMVLPQHLISPSVYCQQKDQSSQTPLQQLVYPNHMPLRSAHTPPNFLGHQDNEFQYAPYQGMDIFTTTSTAHSTSDGNRFVWPMNYAGMGNESLEHSTISTWPVPAHEDKGNVRDIASSKEGSTSGFLRSASPGRNEAKYE